MKLQFRFVVLLSTIFLWAKPLYSADQAPSIPSTDIIVLSINPTDKAMMVDTANSLNVIKFDGYDNQPHFSNDGKQLYFTRMLGVQTDVFAYHYDDQQFTNITNTDDISEYSPTVYNESAISVIGVNPDGQQHLRLVNIKDASQQVLNPAIEPVGYHAWLNEKLSAVFVLGEVMTLQLFDLSAEGSAEPLASDIGRCLQRVAKNKVSFTKLIDGLHHIFLIDQNGSIAPTGIVLPVGVQDYVWWDTEGVLVGIDSQLWYISDTKKEKIADLDTLDVSNISRLALDSHKQKLAIVYE